MTRPNPDECTDHWHCDPTLAPHVCDAPNRAQACPTCGAPSEHDIKIAQAILDVLMKHESALVSYETRRYESRYTAKGLAWAIFDALQEHVALAAEQENK